VLPMRIYIYWLTLAFPFIVIYISVQH